MKGPNSACWWTAPSLAEAGVSEGFVGSGVLSRKPAVWGHELGAEHGFSLLPVTSHSKFHLSSTLPGLTRDAGSFMTLFKKGWHPKWVQMCRCPGHKLSLCHNAPSKDEHSLVSPFSLSTTDAKCPSGRNVNPLPGFRFFINLLIYF